MLKCWLAEIPLQAFGDKKPGWICARGSGKLEICSTPHEALKFADEASAQQACDSIDFPIFPAKPMEHIFETTSV